MASMISRLRSRETSAHPCVPLMIVCANGSVFRSIPFQKSRWTRNWEESLPLRRQLLEGVEYFETWPTEILVVARCDGQAVLPGGGGNVAVFDRHRLTSFFQQMLLIRPDMGDADIESVNSPLHRLNQARQPRLQLRLLPALFDAHPIGQLRDDHRARVAAILLLPKPGDHPRIAIALRRLREHVCIENPTHSLRFFGRSRRRRGTSSIGTGHSARTFSQSSRSGSRRKITASSSSSNRASKDCPGRAGISAVGSVRRRLESNVTIMVGLSHRDDVTSTSNLRIIAPLVRSAQSLHRPIPSSARSGDLRVAGDRAWARLAVQLFRWRELRADR